MVESKGDKLKIPRDDERYRLHIFKKEEEETIKNFPIMDVRDKYSKQGENRVDDLCGTGNPFKKGTTEVVIQIQQHQKKEIHNK